MNFHSSPKIYKLLPYNQASSFFHLEHKHNFKMTHTRLIITLYIFFMFVFILFKGYEFKIYTLQDVGLVQKLLNNDLIFNILLIMFIIALTPYW